MRSDSERLVDIAEAIERIDRYGNMSFEEFANDELIQVWVLHHLQIIGEAIRNLSPEFRSLHPDVSWSDIVGMRNIIVHSYFGINTRLVWRAVVSNVPSLSGQIKAIMDELGIDIGDEPTS